MFIISILGDEQFYFPEPFDNGIRLKDLLEEKVDERFYINQEKTDKLISELKNKNSLLLDMQQYKRENAPREYTNFTPTLNARDYKEPKLINSNEISARNAIPCLTPDRSEKRQNGRRFKENNDPMFSLTCQDIHGVALETVDELHSMQETSYCIDANYYKGITLDSYMNKKRRQLFMENKPECIGRIDIEGHDYLKRVYSEQGISPTIGTCQGGQQQPKTLSNYRIRKLTPKECWRLMGFSDDDYETARKTLNDTFYNGKDRSGSQLYKMAGNSIVVDVLYYIFKNLLIETESKNDVFFEVV